jgi:hypothetical protein
MNEPTKPKVVPVESQTVRWDSRVKLAQDFLSLSKEVVALALVVAVLCLLAFHFDVVRGLFSHFSGELANAKLSEINIAGLKLSFEDSAQKLETAKLSIDSTKKALQDLADKTTDPSMKDKLGKLLGELDTAVTATNAAQEGIQAGIKKQEQAIGAAAGGTTAEGNWIVVVSADKDKDQAQYEVDQLSKLGYKSARIYDRKGWFRTVVPFSSRADANEALLKIRQYRRAAAYVADMTAWCPQTQQNASTGFSACVGPTSSD